MRRFRPADSPDIVGAISCSGGASAAGAFRRALGAMLAFTVKAGSGVVAAEGPRLRLVGALDLMSGAGSSGALFTRRLAVIVAAANCSLGSGIEGVPAHSAMFGS